METKAGKDRHGRSKIKGAKRLFFPPRMRKNSKASSAGQHEGFRVGGVRTEPILGSGRGGCYGEAGCAGRKLSPRNTDDF